MKDIKSLLDSFFKHEEVLDERGAIWVSQRPNHYLSGPGSKTNYKKIENEYLGMTIVAPSLVEIQGKGAWITVYSADKDLTRSGDAIGENMPNVKDCATDYYGFYLNLIAFIYDRPIYRLTHTNVGLGVGRPRIMSVNHRSDLAESFLSDYLKKEEKIEKVKQLQSVTQPQLF